jgi:hypothetical protein
VNKPGLVCHAVSQVTLSRAKTKTFPDQVDDSGIGLKAWPSGQAGRGVACWRVADRSALGKDEVLGGALVPLDLIPVVRRTECLPETQQMPMDAERPSPDPRPTTRHQTTPRPADSFVQSAKPAPNELPVCRSGGCRVVRVGRGAEIAPDRSASSPTREVWRKPEGRPSSTGGIHWRQRPRTWGLQRIRSSRPA